MCSLRVTNSCLVYWKVLDVSLSSSRASSGDHINEEVLNLSGIVDQQFHLPIQYAIVFSFSKSG